MKRIYSIGSFLFGLAVFSAILLQSVHSFHHLEEVFSKDHCHHDYTKNNTQITHSHQFDNCFVCEFTFSNSIKKEVFSFHFQISKFPTSYSFSYSKEIVNHFKGSLFALRAPPIFIV